LSSVHELLNSTDTGHHTVREPPAVPVPVWLDGATEGVAVEADAGRDGEAAVRASPGDPGHACAALYAAPGAPGVPRHAQCTWPWSIVYS